MIFAVDIPHKMIPHDFGDFLSYATIMSNFPLGPMYTVKFTQDILKCNGQFAIQLTVYINSSRRATPFHFVHLFVVNMHLRYLII